MVVWRSQRLDQLGQKSCHPRQMRARAQVCVCVSPVTSERRLVVNDQCPALPACRSTVGWLLGYSVTSRRVCVAAIYPSKSTFLLPYHYCKGSVFCVDVLMCEVSSTTHEGFASQPFPLVPHANPNWFWSGEGRTQCRPNAPPTSIQCDARAPGSTAPSLSTEPSGTVRTPRAKCLETEYTTDVRRSGLCVHPHI